MKIVRIVALAGVVATMLAPPAHAQLELDVTPFTGGTFFLADPPDRFRLGHASDDLVLENARFTHSFTLGLDVGVVLDERWTVEAMASWLPTSLKAARGLQGVVDVNAFMYGLTALSVTDRLALRVEARDCFARFDSGVVGVDDGWENDLMTTLGFSFRTSLR